MSTRIENDSEFDDFSPKPSPGRRFTLGTFLLIPASVALLIALLLPAVRSSGPAARRAQCVNNLKQIALALYQYEQAYKLLPPAYTTDPAGRPLHSWRTLILPYLEQKQLYEKIDLSKPWDDPANAAAAETRLSAFDCPESGGGTNATAYLASVGPDGFLAPGRGRRLEEITDGLTSTLAVIEVGKDDAVPWMAPRDADAATVMRLDTETNLHHAGGVNMLLADGGVRFLKANAPAAMRRALLSIAGNDNDANRE